MGLTGSSGKAPNVQYRRILALVSAGTPYDRLHDSSAILWKPSANSANSRGPMEPSERRSSTVLRHLPTKRRNLVDSCPIEPAALHFRLFHAGARAPLGTPRDDEVRNRTAPRKKRIGLNRMNRERGVNGKRLNGRGAAKGIV
ncbi:hypothetical protein KM043_000431 [Ampulex compressa]|nr:hypothetical protein KM043_000431 [Ampulex compressa]